MRHDRPNKPRPELPFLMVEAKSEQDWTDEAWDAALAQPVEVSDSGKRAARERAGLEPAPRATRPPSGKFGNRKQPFDAGEFRLVARLAVGGMSEVWLADALQGELQGRSVVVKRLLPSLRTDPGSVERFRAEGLLGAALQHDNLARTHGLHSRGLEMFLVQELLGGETLGLLAAAARKRGERLSLPALLHAADGMLAALAFLHGDGGEQAPVRVIHGDVNPDNLVCTYDGGVKLIDLGLAQTLRTDGTVASPDGALRGTPAYMSPEQVKSRPLSPRSDLFSAGVVLWELFANRPLFASDSEFETLRRVRELTAPPLRAVWPQAPTALERLLVRVLAKDPAQRFSSATELREGFLHIGRQQGVRDGESALSAEVIRLAPKGPKADER
jgi:serine/threonine protein kinase